MLLLVVYIILVAIMSLVAVFTGLIVEQWWGAHLSLMYFLATNFLSLWFCWVLAVKLTGPKAVGRT